MLLFPVSLMNRFNQTESAVFELCIFSVFLKDPLLQILYKLLQDKTNKMACALSENSDQPGNVPSLIYMGPNAQ